MKSRTRQRDGVNTEEVEQETERAHLNETAVL